MVRQGCSSTQLRQITGLPVLFNSFRMNQAGTLLLDNITFILKIYVLSLLNEYCCDSCFIDPKNISYHSLWMNILRTSTYLKSFINEY